jgi:hypothetical protein
LALPTIEARECYAQGLHAIVGRRIGGNRRNALWSRSAAARPFPVRRTTMMDDVTQVAIEQRRQQADTVLEIRSRILEERVAQAAEVDEVSPGASAEDAGAPDPALVRAAGGATSRGVLVAEGDSWFDYPWFDVLGLLEDQHRYDVRPVAHKGGYRRGHGLHRRLACRPVAGAGESDPREADPTGNPSFGWRQRRRWHRVPYAAQSQAFAHAGSELADRFRHHR